MFCVVVVVVVVAAAAAAADVSMNLTTTFCTDPYVSTVTSFNIKVNSSTKGVISSSSSTNNKGGSSMSAPYSTGGTRDAVDDA